MRNLKRVLSLVMMIAMLAGLMVIGASAAYEDFTDKDQIQNKVAVQTLVELNVIAGKEDGSFYDPQGLLTRAEAAKLVCVVLNGGKAPVLADPDYVSYKDTKGTWGAAYIEYVTGLKIVAGDGQGYFKPNETVTATQLAKMLLVAIGYDASFEGLVGNAWDSKTDALANQNGLYEELDGLITSNPLNRDNAAQIIYNALTAHLVRYQSAGEGGGVGIVADPLDETVLSRYFNTDTVVGVISANEVFSILPEGTPTAKNKIQVIVRSINDVKQDNMQTPPSYYPMDRQQGYGPMMNFLILPVGVDNDLVGQEVVVYVKNMGKTTQSVIGSPIATENNKIVSTMASLKTEAKANAFLKDNGMQFNANNGPFDSTYLVYNGEFYGIADIDDDLYCECCGYAGIERRLVDNNGDGKADILFYTEKYLEKVTAYNTKDEEITFSDFGTYDFADVIAYDGIAKGDYVLVYDFGPTYMYAEKAATVTGTATAYNTANGKLTVGNKAYDASALGNYTYELDDYAPGTHMVGNTYVFYLDNAGNVIATGNTPESAKNYALVRASNADVDILGAPSGTIKMVLANGSTKTYTVNLVASANKYIDANVFTSVTKTDSTDDKAMAMAGYLAQLDEEAVAPLKNPAADAMKDQIVTYVVNDDGTVTIAPTQADADGTDDVNEPAIRSNTSYVQGSDTILANNSTVYFFVNDDGEVTVVKGINSLPISDTNAGTVTEVAYTESDGKFTAQAVRVGGTVAGAESFVYILEAPTYTNVNGKDLYTYSYVTASGAGKIETATSEQADLTAGLYTMAVKGNYVVFTADDVDTLADKMASNLEIAQISADGTMIMSDSTEVNVASTVKVIDVTDTDSPAVAVVSDLAADNVVSVVLNDDGLAVGIFITASTSTSAK